MTSMNFPGFTVEATLGARQTANSRVWIQREGEASVHPAYDPTIQGLGPHCVPIPLGCTSVDINTPGILCHYLLRCTWTGKHPFHR